MVIASYGFLLLFLPLTLFLYWRTQHKLLVLCLASYTFYALGGLILLPLLLGLSLITYWLALRGRIGLGIVVNLAALAFFKYWNFGADSLNSVTQALGLNVLLPLLDLMLPLGLSFYTFKHIGYLLDIRAGRYSPTHNPLLFVTYSAFFPQISAGPLSLTDDTLKQLASLPERIDSTQIYQGLTFISIGIMKKVLIADPLSATLGNGLFEANGGAGLLWAWGSVSMYAIQLYFDFSAYTDLALGVGLLFGITLPPNFNNPYLATTPADFWTRWHISLSMWFRIYLFFPLSRTLLKRWGGTRGEAAQYVANLITMGLIGLWHGAGWGFVLWGLYHGALLNLYAWGKRRNIRLESHVLLLVCILVGWALFLSPSLPFAQSLLSSMIGFHGIGSLQSFIDLYGSIPLTLAVIALLLIASGRVEAANITGLNRPGYALALGILAGLCLLQLGTVSEFIYVQF